MRRIMLAFLLFTLAPAAASALTVPEVVTLTKAGVAEEVLLALIDRDHTIFALTADQLIALKRDGVSEKVVIAMLHSGRQEAPLQLVASDPPQTFTEPIVVAVGHGPDAPNTYHYFDRLGMSSVFSLPLGTIVVPVPVFPPRRAGGPWRRMPAACATAGHAPVAGFAKAVDSPNCRPAR